MEITIITETGKELVIKKSEFKISKEEYVEHRIIADNSTLKILKKKAKWMPCLIANTEIGWIKLIPINFCGRDERFSPSKIFNESIIWKYSTTKKIAKAYTPTAELRWQGNPFELRPNMALVSPFGNFYITRIVAIKEVKF
jgi:hypothetical protein